MLFPFTCRNAILCRTRRVCHLTSHYLFHPGTVSSKWQQGNKLHPYYANTCTVHIIRRGKFPESKTPRIRWPCPNRDHRLSVLCLWMHHMVLAYINTYLTLRFLPVMIHSIMADCVPQSMREMLIICLLISCPVAGFHGTNSGCSRHWHAFIAAQETYRGSNVRIFNHHIQKRFQVWYSQEKM